MDTDTKVEMYRRAKILVRTINRKSINKMKEKCGNEISHAEFRVILFADPENGTPLGKIAERWSMHMSNLTKIVNSLIGRGYAYKQTSESDKRVKLLFLTDEGKRKKEKFIREFEDRIDECLVNVSSESINNALEAINEVLGQMQGEQ